MRKKLIILAALLAVSLNITGCSHKSDSPKETKPQVKTKTDAPKKESAKKPVKKDDGRSVHVQRDEEAGLFASAEASRKSNIYKKETRQKDEVLLSFTGDISFADGYSNMNYYYGAGGLSACISDDVRSRMKAADIMMINNEFTYGNKGEPLPGKDFTFRAKPEMVENMKKLSADLVSVANNHVYDYGPEGLLETLRVLKNADIPYVGAGQDLGEAKKSVSFIAGGRKITYVSATQIERSTLYTKPATDTSPGVLRTYDPALFAQVIKEAKEQSDFVVAYVHWGTEGSAHFAEDQRQLGMAFVDAGADLVVGTHTHCLQGIEYYKGVPVIYSLGNFWFNSRTLDTGMLEAVVDKNGLKKLRFVPCIQKGCRTTLTTDPSEKSRILKYVESLSSGVSIAGDGTITEVKKIKE